MSNKAKRPDEMTANARMKEIARILAIVIKREFFQSPDFNKESANITANPS